jgi:Mn-dependent DtxR family transcriptional regulator
MAYHNRVSDNTQDMVYGLLKDEADMDGFVIVPYTYLAEKLGLSAISVGAAVQKLISRGMVVHHGSSTIHRIATLEIVDI